MHVSTYVKIASNKLKIASNKLNHDSNTRYQRF